MSARFVSKVKHPSIARFALLAFFALAMLYPLSHILARAFIINGSPSLHFFGAMLSSSYYRDALCASINIALAVTLLSSLAAYPLALVMCRHSIACRGVLHSLLLLPLISPPFVGALGFRQLFGRFGSVNALLRDFGLIEVPIPWLADGGVFGIIALQTLHLTPVLYLSISASLHSAHLSLEDSGRVFGATRAQILRKIVIPLSLPGWFAGASLVFIASFTDLGTPLIFDYRGVVPVQIYNMLSDINENPIGYSFVVLTCSLSLVIFYLSSAILGKASFAGSTRSVQGRQANAESFITSSVLTLVLFTYACFASTPQIAVVLVASAKNWFDSVLPTEWTTNALIASISHPMTAHSLLTSLWLSLGASVITLVIGSYAAYVITRGRGTWSRMFEVLSIIPLAIPGIVFAFGYIGAFSGTPLDNRINPFPLLLVAYAIRRMPAMVRSGCAGLQEASCSLEEAARVLGASPLMIFRRILMPLASKHLLVGAVLTFAYSMIEVSDSILLALEVKFYPVSKAIYTLMGRPDGVELASALGSLVMLVMLVAFYFAEWLSFRAERRRLVSVIVTLAALFSVQSAHAQVDQIVAVSPHWEGIKYEFERGFAEVYKRESGRDVAIRWLDIGGSSDIVKYLKGQHRLSPGNIGIDLVFGGGTDTMIELSRSGILQAAELSSEVAAAIPASVGGVPLYDRERTWYIAAISFFGIIVNSVGLERLGLPAPNSWSDLGEPKYRDLVGIADPSKSGSMHSMCEVILQGVGWTEGWKLLTRIAANARVISNHASQVGKEIAAGEMVLGIAIDTYAGDVIRQVGPQRVKFITPSDFASMTGDGIGLIAGAPNPSAARRFIEFVLSEQGQKLWYYKRGTRGGPQRFEIGKLPILSKLYDTGEPATVVQGNPFTFTNVKPFDAQLAARRWNIVNDLYKSFIVEVHDRLTDYARRFPDIQPPANPVSEDEVASLSPSGEWGADQVQRSAKLAIWRDLVDSLLPAERGPFYRFRWLPALAVILLMVILKKVRNFSF